MSAADRIADVILRQGEIVGRGAERKGAIYGGMLQDLGQQITALPTYVQNQRMREQEVQMRNQEMGIRQHALDQAKAQEQAQRILDQAYPQFVSSTGELNSGGLAEHLAKSGLGHLVPTVLENAQKYSEAQSRALKARAEADDAQGEAAKRIGDGMQAMLDGGASLEDVAGFGGFKIKAGVTSGLIPREDGIGMLTQLDPSNPDTVKAMIKRLQAAGTPAKAQTIGAGGLRLPSGEVVPPAARPATPPAPGAGNRVINGQLVGPNGERIGAPVPEQVRPPVPKSLTTKAVLLDGKPTELVFDPADGSWKQGTETIDPKRIRPIPPASQSGGGPSANPADDIKQAIAGMKDGTLPPQMPGRASKDYTAIMAEAHRQGFDLAGAVTDWTATQAHIKTLNGAQQTRLNQAIGALPDLLDSVDELSKKWDNGRFPVLNRANLALAKNGAFGKEAASLANQLTTQIADVVADLGTVYMGGNSPTDHGMDLAKTALSADWDRKVLHDMVGLAKKNVQIRQNSIRNVGVQGASEGNVYAPKPEAAAPSASSGVSVTAPNGKVYTFPTAADAAAFKARAGIK